MNTPSDNTPEERTQALRGAEMPPVPRLPPVFTANVDLCVSSPSCCDENEANVAPLSFASDDSPPVAAVDDVGVGSSMGSLVAEAAVVEEGDADAVMVASPASKFPVEKPTLPAVMTNHDKALYAKGYDSDGELPYFDPIAEAGEDPESYKEPTISIDHPPKELQKAPTPEPMVDKMTTTAANQLKVNKLKHELKKRGCKATWNKTELLKRLIDAINNKIPVANIADIEKRDSCLNGLAPTAYWKELTIDPTPVPEPINLDTGLLPPTEMDGSSPNPKYKFTEQFSRPEFSGMKEVLVTSTPKRPRKGKKLSPPVKKGRASLEFTKVPRASQTNCFWRNTT